MMNFFKRLSGGAFLLLRSDFIFGPMVERGFAVLFLAIVFNIPAHRLDAQEKAEQAHKAVAIGLAGVADWSTQNPFIDVMKTSRPWLGHLRGEFGGFDNDALQEGGYLDKDGWPLALPRGVEALETYVLTEQPAEGRSLEGRYILSYEGTGRVEITGQVRDLRYRNNEIHFTYAPFDGLVGVRVSRIDPAGTGNHIRNIRIMREEHVPLYQLGLRFNPDWLAVIRDMRVLRFMDWMGTNGSTQVAWADRPRIDDATYAHYVAGVPVEVMVDLANEVGSDPWFTMPHMAGDDYIRRFASYVRDNLNPNLKAYVEYSNEVWNWQFAQATWAAEQGRARWGDGVGNGWVQFAGVRAAQVAQIWTDVFGDSADQRLVRVIATQAGWLGLEEGLLLAPNWVAEDKTHRPPYEAFDAYAVTGYFAVEGDADEMSNRILGWLDQGEEDATERLLEHLQTNAVNDLINRIFPYHAGIADQYNLQLIMYEGGTHVVGFAHWVDNQRLTNFFTLFNYTPGVAALYRQVMEGWHAAGGTLFNAFVDVYKPIRWGSWGHLRHLDDMNPRWQVLLEYNATTAVTWETRAPDAFGYGVIRNAPADGAEVRAQHPRDILIGGKGNDVLVSTGCCARIHGGEGRNVAVLPGSAAEYDMMWMGDVLLLQSNEGQGRLINIHEIRFDAAPDSAIRVIPSFPPKSAE